LVLDAALYVKLSGADIRIGKRVSNRGSVCLFAILVCPYVVFSLLSRVLFRVSLSLLSRVSLPLSSPLSITVTVVGDYQRIDNTT
jgi:hypothetical protein